MIDESIIKPLKDLCDNFKNDIVDGPFGANLKREHYTNEGVPVLKIQNVKAFEIILKKMDYISSDKAAELKRHAYKKGDIIITKLGMPLGASAIVNEDMDGGVIVADLVRVRASKVDTKYLCYHLNSPNTCDYLNAQSSGATRPRVKISAVRELPIYIPPLLEQKRIVAILDEAYAGISLAVANAEKNLANARELFESVKKLTIENGKLTVGCEEKALTDITSLLGDGLHGTPKYSDNGEYYFINGNNLNNGTIKFKEKTRRVSLEEYYKYKKELTDRTVLVSINGTLGNVAFYNNEQIILGKSACYFNLLEGINKHYIKYVILSPYFLKYAHNEATGATIKNVSLKSMRAFKVPLPSLEIQNNIVRKLDVLSFEITKLEAFYQQKLTNLNELKQSILQKAFTGQLTNATDKG